MSVRLSTCKLQRSISAAASLRYAEFVNIRHVHYYFDFDFDVGNNSTETDGYPIHFG